MKVFVVGSNGYLGSAVARALESGSMDIRRVSSRPGPGVLHLDLSAPETFSYSHINAGDIVLMTAALSSPDICRDQYDVAYEINVVGTGHFIERCLALGARVIFFSSDTVYGPGNAECSETENCKPAGEYGLMKNEVETRFKDHLSLKVLRLSYVMSSEDKFMRYLSACVSDCKEAEIFHPMFRRAVYLGDLIDLITILCTSWDMTGYRIINVCGPELVSRVDMATMYRDIVSPGLHFTVVRPSDDFFMARPQVINMSNFAFQSILGRIPRTIRDAIYIAFGCQKGGIC
ncbi:MAG TPA: sugar nucleotide-binding protein [Desulfuromonadales bacterium]|nr:sugar nucleotide-binding protein [Desulfuromonadales bacterium]